MGKLCGGRSHVVLLVGSRGAKGTEGFRTEQLSTRRVIILFPMSRTFSAINKDLEITQRKLSATSDTEQRRFLLRHMRQLLSKPITLSKSWNAKFLQSRIEIKTVPVNPFKTPPASCWMLARRRGNQAARKRSPSRFTVKCVNPPSPKCGYGGICPASSAKYFTVLWESSRSLPTTIR